MNNQSNTRQCKNNRQNNNRQSSSRQNISRQNNNRPCIQEQAETAANECPQERMENECPCENQIIIEGRVTYRGQGIHLATVVVTRNRQVVAECLTDCEGCYEFKGQRASYTLRAHKNNRRSRPHTVLGNNKDKIEVNFNLM